MSLHDTRRRNFFCYSYLTFRTVEDRLETLPGCSECAYLPFCGADPVRNWATQGDIVGHRPTSEFCRKHKAIFDLLFERLLSDDRFVHSLFWAWANQ